MQKHHLLCEVGVTEEVSMILERDKLIEPASLHFPICPSEMPEQPPQLETVVFFTDDDRQVLLRKYAPSIQRAPAK